MAERPADEILVAHRLPGPPVEAVLEERENRFLARCRLAAGEVVHAHVPDRGRLLGLLVPQARVWLYAANPLARAAARRTRWSLLVAEDPVARVLVAIDPAGANARARPILERGLLPALGAGWTIRPEITIGASRFDFELRRGDQRLIVEVKSVGVVRDGRALFPDAPTTRGVRHFEELAILARASGPKTRAALLFVAQRADAQAVAADRAIDPLFAATLERVRGELTVLAIGYEITPAECRFRGILPVL